MYSELIVEVDVEEERGDNDTATEAKSVSELIPLQAESRTLACGMYCNTVISLIILYEHW